MALGEEPLDVGLKMSWGLVVNKANPTVGEWEWGPVLGIEWLGGRRYICAARLDGHVYCHRNI